MRVMLFEGIIYKHVAWFDSKDKATGVLSNVLSEDITLLNGLSTESISIILESLFTIIIGIALSLYFSWRMALITLAMIPLVMLGGLISNKLTAKARGATSGVAEKNIDAGQTDNYKESNALLSDLIMNYRTVISFGPKNIEYLMSKYNQLLLEPCK
jgi:ATP-binding cassette subfamily B (MDR/TAP) protein 1